MLYACRQPSENQQCSEDLQLGIAEELGGARGECTEDAVPQGALCIDAQRTVPKYALAEFSGPTPAPPTVRKCKVVEDRDGSGLNDDVALCIDKGEAVPPEEIAIRPGNLREQGAEWSEARVSGAGRAADRDVERGVTGYVAGSHRVDRQAEIEVHRV